MSVHVERRAGSQARSIADGALTTVRDLSQLLHPALLDDMGLPWAVEWYLRGFGWIGAIGSLAVAAVGASVSRWFGPSLTSVRFALLAMGLLVFFRWMGL